MQWVIYFIVSLYWVQTDWSGSSGQEIWEDTSSYFAGEGINGSRSRGELYLSAPSDEWEIGKEIDPEKEVTAIIEADSGVIYVGCGWDSARVFKLGAFGDSIISESALNNGRVKSLLRLHNQNILVGTNNGELFIGKDTSWTFVKNFGDEVLSLYQPPDFNYVYLGTGSGQIWISETSGETWRASDPHPLPNTNKILDIFSASNKIFYACTKGSDGKGRVFWSLYDGDHWDTLHSFPGTESVYSICECPSANLYVSTGYQGSLFMSSDSGRNWQEINSPSNAADFYHIISDPYGVLYVGGKCHTKVPRGMVFMSEDKGLIWDTLFCSKGVHPSKILAFTQSHEGFLFAGGDTNVFFRSGYNSSGWLESSWFDVFKESAIVNNSLEFGRVHYNSSGPQSGGDVKLKIRTTRNLDSIPAWGDYVPNDSNPVGSGSALDGDRYIQCRVELFSDFALETSSLSEICLAYKIDVKAPNIDSVSAYDGAFTDSSVDKDDYVKLNFDEPTNEPRIETSNIDKILRLSGGHSWKSDSGRGVIKFPGEWVTPSILKIYLSTLKIGVGEGYPPTIEIGDTIYPDSISIFDKWGNICWSSCVIRGSFAGVEENEKLQVTSYKLQVHPNPFKGEAVIRYSLNDCTVNDLRLTIHDIAGRLVRTLVDGKKKSGNYSVKVQGLGSGVYFLKFKVGDKIISTKKIISFK